MMIRCLLLSKDLKVTISFVHQGKEQHRIVRNKRGNNKISGIIVEFILCIDYTL